MQKYEKCAGILKPMKWVQVVGYAALCAVFGSFAPIVHADGLTVAGTDTYAGIVDDAIAITDLAIEGESVDPVPVKLLVSEGTLEMSTTDGLTFTGDEAGSELYFSGSIEDLNAALATLTYTRNDAGTDTLEISLVEPGEVFFPGNGHLYEYISSTLTWTAAESAAEALTRYGASGYLTTITSAEENEFVADRLENAGWMGASDGTAEGDWRWVTGPEDGTAFWLGTASGTTTNDGYENWGTGEPNNSGTGAGEDCAQFLSGGTGQLNDLPCTVTTLPGYVVEFGEEGDMPEVAALDIALFTHAGAPTVTVSAPDADAELPEDETFDMEVELENEEGIVAGVRYYINGELALTSSEAPYATEMTIFAPGEQELIAVAIDSDGQSVATSTAVSFAITDETAPTLESFTPADGATDVSLDTNFTLTFSEPVGWIAGNFLIRDASDNTYVAEIAAGGGIIAGLGTNTLTINPSNNLEYDTDYYIQIEGTAIADDGGNEYAGISDATTWNFTTEDNPPSPRKSVRLNREEVTTGSQDMLASLRARVAALLTQLAALRAGVQTSTSESPTVETTSVRDLELGMEGDDVRMLQEVLIAADRGPSARELARVGVTGYFSNYTANALGEYQLASGIVPHAGYFGEITRAQMKTAGLSGLWW